jgi:hypothetical protein
MPPPALPLDAAFAPAARPRPNTQRRPAAPPPPRPRPRRPPAPAAGLPSVTLNRSLFEGALRELLLEGGQHSVELWEGYGAHWRVAK